MAQRRGRTRRRVPGTGQSAYREPRQDASKRQLSLMIGAVVYAIRVGDEIKIGWTSQLHVRVSNFGGWDSVLGFTNGTLEDEQRLHEQLSPWRAHDQEWYYPAPEVLAVVNEWRDTYGLPPVERAVFAA